MATLPGSKASLTKKQKYEKLAGQLKNDQMSFISHWKDSERLHPASPRPLPAHRSEPW
jgi:hypothetical protein